jgi:hypothetical protein
MTKEELCKKIRELIEPNTTPDPQEFTDGAVLDMIYELVKEEV